MVLFAAAIPAFGAKTAGWLQACCDTADFRFTKFPGRAAGEELRIRISSHGANWMIYRFLNDWWGTLGGGKVTGERCNQAGECEKTTKSDLQVQKVTMRRMFGKYVVDINGQHLEGQFVVKYRKRDPKCICE